MTENKLLKALNSKDIAIAGIAVVVAASSMVTDFTGFVELGLGFALSLLIGFLIHLALGYSLSNLASKYPKAGTLFNYSKEIIKGKKGTYIGLFLGLTFYMGVSFGISAEANAGAFALKKLVGLEIPDMCYVLFLFL